MQERREIEQDFQVDIITFSLLTAQLFLSWAELLFVQERHPSFARAEGMGKDARLRSFFYWQKRCRLLCKNLTSFYPTDGSSVKVAINWPRRYSVLAPSSPLSGSICPLPLLSTP